jgi:outer membrane protein, multidrug efflux system
MKLGWLLWVLAFPLQAAVVDQITYSDALDVIVDRHPEVATQAAQVEVARGRSLSTRLALLPSLSLNARQDIRNEFGLNADRLGIGASLDMNLFRFGSDIAGMKAAHREIDSEIASLTAARVRVESSAVEALNQWLVAGQELEILSRVLKWREHLLEIGKKRFTRGLIAQQEVDKISIDWENDLAMLRDAQTNAVRADALVDQLLGHHSVRNEWPWKGRLSQRVFSAIEKDENSLRERPDWRAAELRVLASQERTSQSWGRIFPSLDLNISYGYFSAQQSGVSVNRAEYSGSFVLSVPLFDRLSSYGAYAAQVETTKQAELEMERTRRLARAEWDAARGSITLAVDTALARDKTLAVARGLYDDNVLRFERGLIEANGLSVDQQRLLVSEQLAVRGWAAAHSTLAKLCFSRGLRIKECL